MPAKTGGSHALATFVSMVVGTVLSKYVWNHTPSLARAGVVVRDLVASTTGVTMTRQTTGMLVVVVAVSFAWGVVYHFARHS
ncbi:MAG: hypothetical protein ABEJ40_05795 [Haloarculaceae archaeon]